VPLGASLSALVLAEAMVAIDRQLGAVNQSPFAFSGGPATAQNTLATIATAVLSFTGLVFSITIVALQLASSQFSPRVLRTFLRDRGTKVTLGIFVGTFVYTILVLQSIREGADHTAIFVPGDAVTVASLLVLCTVLAFVYFVNHITNAIRVVSIIEAVAHETRDAIEANFPPAVPPDERDALDGGDTGADRRRVLDDLEAPVTVVGAHRAGVVTGFDTRALLADARRLDAVLELVPAVGDYVPFGAPLIRIHGVIDAEHGLGAIGRIGIEHERTMEQDVQFGFRQLVDIAEKALSPAINDPTTAVQSIDRIHDLLRRLILRPFPSGLIDDDEGELRLVIPTPSWEEVVVLGTAEIRGYGVQSLQVHRRLHALIDDLLQIAPTSRVGPLSQLRSVLDRGVGRGFDDGDDQRLARVADAGGLGSDDGADDGADM
jgi:uncharacterized membrane protein